MDGAIDDQEALERLKRALAEGESQRIEFIDDLPEDPKELGKEIAALATSNQGTIYLGISNDTEPVGVAGISGPTDAVGKDYYSRRIADIAGAVDPPILPDIEFIHYNGKVIVEIFVPKGAKPVYSYHFRPYLRYITSSRPAKAAEVEDLFRRAFRAEVGAVEVDPKITFGLRLLRTVSGLELAWQDHENRSVHPDIDQLKSEFIAAATALREIAKDEVAKEIGIEADLRRLADDLEDLGHYRFYIGPASWKEFVDRGSAALAKARELVAKVRPLASLSTPDVRELTMAARAIVEDLEDEWSRAEKHLERGTLDLLKEELRRAGEQLHEIGYLAGDKDPLLGGLIEVGRAIYNLTSQKYFRRGVGLNPLVQISDPLEATIARIKGELGLGS